MSTSNSNEISPSPSPFNAPKFGTLVPNRIFVGGISASTTQEELYELFSGYGCVKEAKIILDRAGISKGYGFVTFESEEDAKRIQKEESIVLKERKLNIAPAIKKQPFSRVYGSPSTPSERVGSPRPTRSSADWNVVAAATADPSSVIANGTVFYHNGAYYSPGLVLAPTDPNCQYAQPQAYYQLMYSPTMYIPQQYHHYQPATTQWTGQPVRWAAQVGSYGQSPSSHVSTSSSTTASTTSQYIYSMTGGTATTPTTSTGQGTGSVVTSTLASVQPSLSTPSNVGDSSANVANAAPMTAAAVTYSYPPPSLLAQYQPQQCGAGDVTEQMPIMEATPIEQTAPNPQDSVGPTKPVNSTGLGAVVHFVQAWPFPPPSDPDDCHVVPTTNTSSFAQGSFHKAYHRKPQYQPSSSPRKAHPHSFGLLPRPSYRSSPQRRGKSRSAGHHHQFQGYYQQHYGGTVEAPTVMAAAHDANGTAHKTEAPTNGFTNSPLTPPPTPMTPVVDGSSTTMVISETTHRFKSLKL